MNERVEEITPALTLRQLECVLEALINECLCEFGPSWPSKLLEQLQVSQSERDMVNN